ncbi:hypothetical protein EAI_07785 [Harpegnathos saltator]|uniref:Uncharacterized protein n=1 Tax=Harpegnathos saltator TaxID=610380 RepID=E2C4X6_HARSA|nr:hypothetical protein EAI_07785 [Harpegnathos saltator]
MLWNAKELTKAEKRIWGRSVSAGVLRTAIAMRDMERGDLGIVRAPQTAERAQTEKRIWGRSVSAGVLRTAIAMRDMERGDLGIVRAPQVTLWTLLCERYSHEQRNVLKQRSESGDDRFRLASCEPLLPCVTWNGATWALSWGPESRYGLWYMCGTCTSDGTDAQRSKLGQRRVFKQRSESGDDRFRLASCGPLLPCVTWNGATWALSWGPESRYGLWYMCGTCTSDGTDAQRSKLGQRRVFKQRSESGDDRFRLASCGPLLPCVTWNGATWALSGRPKSRYGLCQVYRDIHGTHARALLKPTRKSLIKTLLG